MRLLEEFAGTPGSVVFADPPYSAGGKRAGRRLYTHHQIDHPRLFQLLADTAIDFMLTYDHAPEIAALVRPLTSFHAVQVTMKNTHHDRVGELVITADTPRYRHHPPAFTHRSAKLTFQDLAAMFHAF